MATETFPFESVAIRVKQPLGEFFAVSLPARVLQVVCYSNPLRIEDVDEKKHTYILTGTQRSSDDRRLKEIGKFLESSEAAFPNSIILGANYTQDGAFIGDPESKRFRGQAWKITKRGSALTLQIPSSEPVAAIVDGQHRLKAFAYADLKFRDMELLCAVYLDLPVPYQAYLFATINFNQKKVDKSLAYELFGFDVEDQPPTAWPPEKLAVFLCRRLNVDVDSPLRHQIRVAAENREAFDDDTLDTFVSTATIVEGLQTLYSQHPKADRDKMCVVPVDEGRSREVLEPDGTPLRQLFLDCDDAIIYSIVRGFFTAASTLLWSDKTNVGYIRKTVGVQALFDLLKRVVPDYVKSKEISARAFSRQMKPLATIDYADDFFQASGKGRVRLRNSMFYRLGLVKLADLPEDDRGGYKRLASP